MSITRTSMAMPRVYAALTVGAGVWVFAKLYETGVAELAVGGALLIIGGLLAIPTTRAFVSGGALSTGGLSGFLAHVLWIALAIVGGVISLTFWGA